MDLMVANNLAACGAIVQELKSLLYYTHIPAIVLSLSVGFFVLSQSKQSVSAKLLFYIAACFSLWSIIDLIIWIAYDKAEIVVFLWAFFGLLYLMVYVFSYAFFSSYINNKGIPTKEWVVLSLIVLPVIIFLPTQFNVEGYDLVNCQAFEGVWYSNYYYFASFILMIGIFIHGILALRKKRSFAEKKPILLMLISLEAFLFLFFSIGYLVYYLVDIGYVNDFGLEQYGLLGMPLFVSFLAYLIVKFRVFNARLLAAQALVLGLVALVGSQYFFADTRTGLILTTVTVVFSAAFSFFLIRVVKRDVKRKEELQEIATRLAAANEELRRLDNAKSEFISIASHQLRTPLTAIKGFVSLLLEGAYGKMEPGVQDTLNKVYLSNSRLMLLVENLLNISRIESGRIQYQFAEAKIEDIVNELVEMFSLSAHDKKISLTANLPKTKLPVVTIDSAKIREVISNLIDNALKYTKEGSITVSVKSIASGIEITVADTGMGIDPDDLPHLFGKFERGKLASQVNVSSTGLGLYVGKSFVAAHGGTIAAFSDGPGKGSRFVVTLPLKPKVAK